MANPGASDVYDWVIIGSGFGGSVAALRLAERGYRVLVLERGRRFDDQDFPHTNWNLRRYLWAPLLRCFGFLEITPFRDVVVLHASGVGGGSLGYAGVLLEPEPATFATPAWSRHGDWGARLRPHYDTARRMLGVARNPRLWTADHVLLDIARDMGVEASFQPTDVGVFFGEPGREGDEVPDPFFGGDGPPRRGCTHCGGCMVGCRYAAKNTLVKNYLWLAERKGAEIWPESLVRDIRPLRVPGPDGNGTADPVPGQQKPDPRFEVLYRRSTALVPRRNRSVRARNVIVAAGAVGSTRLLLRCRDVTRSLPALSPRLGHEVRTNNEALLGSVDRAARDGATDWSQGVAITSRFQPDPVTTIEPVRHPVGSDFLRFMGAPLVGQGTLARRLARTAAHVLRHPRDWLLTHILPGWARRTTIILGMQNADQRLRLGLGRSPLTLFRHDLVTHPDGDSDPPGPITAAHEIVREFARRTGGIASGSVNEALLDVPLTAHFLGGCPVGSTMQDGVVDPEFRVHGYPGLMVLDGSVLPGNPGVNPSLTITALAEYAISRIPALAASPRQT
jgi:cholesterol oxidase